MSLDGRTYLYVFSRGDITEARHRSDILEHIGMPYAGAIGDAFIFMLDNARANTDQVYMTFLDDKGISVMNWLARSPDLNPIEHTWNILSRRIRWRPHNPDNVQTLIEALVQKLQMIAQKRHQEYATSMSGVCVDERGDHTHYW